MNILEIIKNRRSIRDFKLDKVSKDIITEIIQTACFAPSAMNTQPWEFTVISGEALENIKRENIEKFRAKEQARSEHSVVGWPQDCIYRKRQVDLAKQIFELMDIQREDKQKRSQWIERGFFYFNAPVAIIISTDKILEKSAPLLDLGAVMQNICLCALHYGLGTCIEDQGVMFPDVLRKYANIPESKRIVIAIAIGYPNWDFPANKLKSLREPIEEVAKWCGF